MENNENITEQALHRNWWLRNPNPKKKVHFFYRNRRAGIGTVGLGSEPSEHIVRCTAEILRLILRLMDTTVLIDAKLSKIETLSWENVTYALPPDKGGKEKVRAGQVVAITRV